MYQGETASEADLHGPRRLPSGFTWTKPPLSQSSVSLALGTPIRRVPRSLFGLNPANCLVWPEESLETLDRHKLHDRPEESLLHG
jgi:hypothetical protein